MKLTRYLVLVYLLCPAFAYAQRPLTIVGGVVTANVADTNDFQVTLTANVTGVTLVSTTGSANTPVTPATGYQITMRFVQDATGSRTVAFGGNIATACSVNATVNSVSICRWQYTASSNTWADAGGGGTTTTVGPVINVTNPAYSGCSATPLADYTTCFASVATATTAASTVSVGVPTINSTVVHPMSTSKTTDNDVINLIAGHTGIVGILASSAAGVFSVTDSGGNAYSVLNLKTPVAAGPIEITVFSTGPGLAKAASSITVNSTIAAFYGFIFFDVSGVGSFGQLNMVNTATSVTPTNVQANFVTTTTQDNNNIVATFINYCPGSVVTISQNTGTLQGSYNGSATICGGGLVTNTSATPAVVTTSATLGTSKTWVTSTLELRSVKVTVPTVYFPYQSACYYYSSGLTFLLPVKLQGDLGSCLWYTGTANAIDLGPTNLTSSTYQFSSYYVIDGLTFQGGGSMANGIFINNWVVLVQISNNQFINFGNAASWGVWANGNQNDLYMFGNKHLVNDGSTNIATTSLNTIPRHWVNVTTNSSATTLRFVNNSAACVNGLVGNVGCSFSSINTPLLSIVGLTHDISHNNFMGGFCPAIAMGANDNNTKISYNHIETQTTGCFAITFGSTVNGLRVFNNYFRQASTSALGPSGPGEILTGATIRDNYFTALPAGVEIVKLNNLAGQINNLSSGNMCETTSSGYAAPCPIIHTAGGNITPWNADYAGACTLVNPTGCPAYNFLVTYTVAPKCTASWTGTGVFTGILKVAASTTQLKIDSTVTTDTGVINWSCDPAAQ